MLKLFLFTEGAILCCTFFKLLESIPSPLEEEGRVRGKPTLTSATILKTLQ
jgi:hypothetical protein